MLWSQSTGIIRLGTDVSSCSKAESKESWTYSGEPLCRQWIIGYTSSSFCTLLQARFCVVINPTGFSWLRELVMIYVRVRAWKFWFDSCKKKKNVALIFSHQMHFATATRNSKGRQIWHAAKAASSSPDKMSMATKRAKESRMPGELGQWQDFAPFSSSPLFWQCLNVRIKIYFPAPQAILHGYLTHALGDQFVSEWSS